ncbi:hypothetical protein BJ508DRAFT_309905 [Ascobolus immersus RN42]|uniref:Uncharacterized protein n=1 Tax=Ascobolus immersus RN42 TaxID=1160509 RepID=A0A3N4HX33_ASCIM|nr:hypothetical protein BJ508DRAFT_309905 [Ascobolus immersus RN42]
MSEETPTQPREQRLFQYWDKKPDPFFSAAFFRANKTLFLSTIIISILLLGFQVAELITKHNSLPADKVTARFLWCAVMEVVFLFAGAIAQNMPIEKRKVRIRWRISSVGLFVIGASLDVARDWDPESFEKDGDLAKNHVLKNLVIPVTLQMFIAFGQEALLTYLSGEGRRGEGSGRGSHTSTPTTTEERDLEAQRIDRDTSPPEPSLRNESPQPSNRTRRSRNSAGSDSDSELDRTSPDRPTVPFNDTESTFSSNLDSDYAAPFANAQAGTNKSAAKSIRLKRSRSKGLKRSSRDSRSRSTSSSDSHDSITSGPADKAARDVADQEREP